MLNHVNFLLCVRFFREICSKINYSLIIKI